MAKKPETTFKERIYPQIQPLGWFTKIQQVAKRGDPDFVGSINGQFIAIELKRDERSTPDPLQMRTLLKIRESGGMTFVAYPENWDQVYTQLLTLAQKDRVEPGSENVFPGLRREQRKPVEPRNE